jgi:transposase InsO family protein
VHFVEHRIGDRRNQIRRDLDPLQYVHVRLHPSVNVMGLRRKAWRQLLREGTSVARCTVTRLMSDLTRS